MLDEASSYLSSIPRFSADGPPLVFDVGAAEGEDTDYYLRKGCRVVAIDANPHAVSTLHQRFNDVPPEQLLILNCGVGLEPGKSQFHVNLAESAISTFLPEAWGGREWVQNKWNCYFVTTLPLSAIIYQLGHPFYIKIDVEHLDCSVLLDMIKHGITPQFLSVEAQDLTAFSYLQTLGYKQFQLTVGETIENRFSRVSISRFNNSPETRDFKRNSSGPFGDDLPPNDWEDATLTWRRLTELGPGWIDIHARF